MIPCASNEKRRAPIDIGALALFWRRHPDLNRGIKVLQTSALPLGYGALFCEGGIFIPPPHGGAEYEIRTRDFHLGKVTLYH